MSHYFSICFFLQKTILPDTLMFTYRIVIISEILEFYWIFMYILRCHWVAVYVNFLIFQIVQSKMQTVLQLVLPMFHRRYQRQGNWNVKMRPGPSPVILSPVLTATVFYLYFSNTVCKFLTIPISFASNLQLRLSKSFYFAFHDMYRWQRWGPTSRISSRIFE